MPEYLIHFKCRYKGRIVVKADNMRDATTWVEDEADLDELADNDQAEGSDIEVEVERINPVEVE